MQRNIKIQSINPYLMCTLCAGYLIDATTLVECLHSFCKSCLLKYLELSYNCPKCGMEIHKTKPLEYIRSDPCLQEIVYKLVPDLFSTEEIRKYSYIKSGDSTGPSIIRDENTDDSRILVTLKYFRGTSRMERIKTEKVLQMFPTRYLCCNPDMPVRVLKKFVCLKFDISPDIFNVEMWRGDETLLDQLTLKQLVQIYGLYRERKPLDLHFSLFPKFKSKPRKEDTTEIKKLISQYHPVTGTKQNDLVKEEKPVEINNVSDAKQCDVKEEEEEIKEEKPRDQNNIKNEPGSRENSIVKNVDSAESERKSNVSSDSNLPMIDDLKLASRSLENNILNIIGSGSGDKSSLDRLMEDDDIQHASETLENEFLKLFDTDSQNNSDASGFDVDLSLEGDFKNITDSLGSDILNLFASESQESSNVPKAIDLELQGKSNISNSDSNLLQKNGSKHKPESLKNENVKCISTRTRQKSVDSSLDVKIPTKNDIKISTESSKGDILKTIDPTTSGQKCDGSSLHSNLLMRREIKHSSETFEKNLSVIDIIGTELRENCDVSKIDSNTSMNDTIKSTSGSEENDFLKYFDVDSKYKTDPSDYDANSTMENDIKNISASLEKDILNLFDPDSDSSEKSNVFHVNTLPVGLRTKQTFESSKSKVTNVNNPLLQGKCEVSMVDLNVPMKRNLKDTCKSVEKDNLKVKGGISNITSPAGDLPVVVEHEYCKPLLSENDKAEIVEMFIENDENILVENVGATVCVVEGNNALLGDCISENIATFEEYDISTDNIIATFEDYAMPTENIVQNIVATLEDISKSQELGEPMDET